MRAESHLAPGRQTFLEKAKAVENKGEKEKEKSLITKSPITKSPISLAKDQGQTIEKQSNSDKGHRDPLSSISLNIQPESVENANNHPSQGKNASIDSLNDASNGVSFKSNGSMNNYLSHLSTPPRFSSKTSIGECSLAADEDPEDKDADDSFDIDKCGIMREGFDPRRRLSANSQNSYRSFILNNSFFDGLLDAMGGEEEEGESNEGKRRSSHERLVEKKLSFIEEIDEALRVKRAKKKDNDVSVSSLSTSSTSVFSKLRDASPVALATKKSGLTERKKSPNAERRNNAKESSSQVKKTPASASPLKHTLKPSGFAALSILPEKVMAETDSQEKTSASEKFVTAQTVNVLDAAVTKSSDIPSASINAKSYTAPTSKLVTVDPSVSSALPLFAVPAAKPARTAAKPNSSAGSSHLDPAKPKKNILLRMRQFNATRRESLLEFEKLEKELTADLEDDSSAKRDEIFETLEDEQPMNVRHNSEEESSVVEMDESLEVFKKRMEEIKEGNKKPLLARTFGRTNLNQVGCFRPGLNMTVC